MKRAFGVYPQTDAGGRHIAIVFDPFDPVLIPALKAIGGAFLEAEEEALNYGEDDVIDYDEASRCSVARTNVYGALKAAAKGWPNVQPPAGVPVNE